MKAPTCTYCDDPVVHYDGSEPDYFVAPNGDIICAHCAEYGIDGISDLIEIAQVKNQSELLQLIGCEAVIMEED